ncbi:polyamine-transporting ATPase 13A3-like isoform X1 [Festucalex cinctus]
MLLFTEYLLMKTKGVDGERQSTERTGSPQTIHRFAASIFYEQHLRLHDMVVEHSMVSVSVCRGGKDFEQVMSTTLVPGDVITIPANGIIMPCDAVLICGTCTVNESMLTGESVPVIKTSLPNSGEEANEIYSTEDHKRHTLFCGSHVIQSRHCADELVKVVVVRTGFSTEKGQLVRSILYPKPTDFKLHRDATHFLMAMVVLAVIGFIYTVTIDVLNEVHVRGIIFDTLNIVIVAVPPILPVALAAGLGHAQRRLKRVGIFCLSPQRINICGQLNLVCFDKTGTLTEDGLDLWGIQRAEDGIFSPADTQVALSLVKTSFVACMATCHSLTTIEGKLFGDPLDLKVFTATGSILDEPREEKAALYNLNVSTVVRLPQQVIQQVSLFLNGNLQRMNNMCNFQSGEFGIVRQFPFSSALQRMSVVVRQLGQKHFDVYLKGAPETVANLCKPHTVPQGFKETLESYTRQGFRVIALAHHQLESELSLPEVQSLGREQIETDMDFLGLIIMQNKIKEQTAGVLLDLRQANIRTLMVTGDNMLTAISVARECGMVQAHERVIIADAVPPNDQDAASIMWRYSENPVLKNNHMSDISFAGEGLHGAEDTGCHFAVSGQAFAVISEHFPQLIHKILLRATVFARMCPEQKTQLVQALQNIDYIVGMCGDGANDCGALKKAHSGISLSELEASAASPFTSTIPNISCMPNLIREGRAALVTSFCVFKYMALFVVILFCSTTLLYSVLTNFGFYQFLFIDIGITFFVVFSMSLNPAWKKLVQQTPETSLISCTVLYSLTSQIFSCLLFQLVAFFLVQQQSWYEQPKSIHHSSKNDLNDLFNVTVTPPSGELYGANYLFADVRNFENTSIFYVSAFQYLTVAIIFSKGKPFRQPSYQNWAFMLSVFTQYAFFLFVLLYPIPAVDDVFQIADIPYEWRITLLIIVLVHAVVSFLLETVNNCWGCAFFSWILCCKKRPPKTKYKCLALKLKDETDWPPAPSTITYASTPHIHTSVPL